LVTVFQFPVAGLVFHVALPAKAVLAIATASSTIAGSKLRLERRRTVVRSEGRIRLMFL